ncbi:MAG: DNA-directed RNA polymerase subunit beta' [Patescibacteria group bacterium]|nr:DNA-directed RNA polymerase subunit beta' [Patescibacteria group bacterium]
MPAPVFTKTLTLNEDKEKIPLFQAIRLKLASPEEILSWSYGEVTKPETINYRTQKPEREGLFCEKIFGPVKDFECACGKYKKLRYRGIICDRCGVEVTTSKVRRERMGHIKLVAPVVHIWFLRGVPSKIGVLLDLSVQTLEKVVYFANFIITKVDEEIKKNTLEQLEEEYKNKRKALKKEIKDKKTLEIKLKDLQENYFLKKREIEEIKIKRILSEKEYHDLSLHYGYFFEAGIGAEAILTLLENLDLKKASQEIELEIKKTTNPARQKKLLLRFKLIRNLIANKIKPDWMVLRVLPVIPPELRPMVQLDGERFASADLNDLYRRIINRNNRLKKLIELRAPEVICRNEKRMLQEAVDALIDNEMRKTKAMVTGAQKRPLKSLADILRGKQGRFRHNLLGKRVDYSGRSVIVVGPELKLDECGLPKTMALELYKPFVISELIKRGFVYNVKSASRLVEEGTKEVWDILEEITKNSYVLLNRAPTLHRLGILAFRPILIEDKAIKIHPLVCPGFNADFDGDQMAVHLPLTEKAQAEAKNIMAASKNLFKPATGDPIVTPIHDIVLGVYCLSLIKKTPAPQVKENKIFSCPEEAILAFELGKIELQEPIKVKIDNSLVEVSVGRLILWQTFPPGLYSLDQTVDQKTLRLLINQCLEIYGPEITVKFLDDLKEISLKYLTSNGLSWGMDDLPELPAKKEIFKKAEEEIEQIQKEYEEGLLTEDERYLKAIEVWTKVRDEIATLSKNLISSSDNPIFFMIDSGARGSWSQVTQMLGMKGLVSSPTGKIIELPVKSSFQEGFNILEFFISTHGARKGVSDTALRTASAGYLTRRMVDVAQEIFIQEEDCGDKDGIVLTKEESEEMGESLANRIFGRVVLEDIYQPKTKKIIVKKGDFVTYDKVKEIEKINLEKIRIRSILTCRTRRGLCVKCYGYDLGHHQPVALGTAVGVIAAQSIGEPGTQLTLRTFHTGGIAGRDITQGLPRVEELFEARPPKRKAILAKTDAQVEKVEGEKEKKITLRYLNQENKEEREVINIPSNYLVWVKEGQSVKKGDPLTDGDFNLHEYYYLKDKEAVQKYILKEVQYIYSSQGQKLNDKHIEIIIRQMFSRVLVKESGETDLLPGEILPRAYVEEVNEKIVKEGKKPAEVKELLLGITRVSLSTDSFLAAASFQETSRVLINAAITGRVDRLHGLKENVIIGRLIPVGTGFNFRKEIEKK